MKLTVQPKKPKNALSKLAKKKPLKKREKDSSTLKKVALLDMAYDSLGSTEVKKLSKPIKKQKLQTGQLSMNKTLSPVAKESVNVEADPLSCQDSSKVALKLKKKLKKVKQSDTLDLTESVVKKKRKSEAKEKKIVATESSEKKNVKNAVPISSGLNRELLEGVCTGILKLVNQSQEKLEKKDLFGDQPQPISLQLSVFKIPHAPYRMVRCLLPHSVQTSDPEVCLIVPDLQRGRKRDTTFAKYVEQYEEKLQENGTTGIKQIIPFTQLRAEYNQFEMKRRLAKTFDVFLCDGRIQGHCVHFLGDIFEKAKKTPVPIHAMAKEDGKFTFVSSLQREVDLALKKVSLTLHSHGTSYSMPIGHSKLTQKQLADNIEDVWRFLKSKLPGGLENIRSAFLKGPRTSAVPLYASFVPPKNVPVVKPKVVEEPVEDELSLWPGRRVTVYPSGEVKLTAHRTEEDDEFTKLNPRLESKKKSKKRKQSQNGTGDESAKRFKTKTVSGVDTDAKQNIDSDDEEVDDDEEEFKDVEAAEAAYLSQWSASASMKELEDEEGKPKKQSKKSKKKKNKLAVEAESKQSPFGKKGISQRFSKGNKMRAKKASKIDSPASKGKGKVKSNKKTSKKPSR